MVDPANALARWRSEVGLKIAYLRLFALPETITLDYAVASLRALEGCLIERLDDADDLGDPDESDFVDGVVAYLGETLMRLAGGAWSWPEAARCPPLVQPDDLLGLGPVSPREMILHALESADGEQFVAVHDEWADAVRQARRTRPSWRPVKEPTSADPPDPDSPRLTAWLAERAHEFDRWVAGYAPESSWDFSTGSLGALQQLLDRVAPSLDELHDPSRRDFVEGAAWYLGEVIRRNLGGRWNFEDRLWGDRNFPYVERVGRQESTCVPALLLENAVQRPGFLRVHFASL